MADGSLCPRHRKNADSKLLGFYPARSGRSKERGDAGNRDSGLPYGLLLFRRNADIEKAVRFRAIRFRERCSPLPRSPNASDDEILAFTNQLIAKHDISGVTVDMVAARAGVSKATIYRHWPSRNALILDAITIMHRPGAKPNTGSIGGDLSILLNELVQFLNRRNGGKVFMAFLNEAIRNPKLAEANHKITSEVRAAYVEAIMQAVARGELRAGIDVDLMIDLLIAPFIYRRLTRNRKIDAGDVTPIVDAVLPYFAAA
jgi:AcrR family transcriptional regulator